MIDMSIIVLSSFIYNNKKYTLKEPLELELEEEADVNEYYKYVAYNDEFDLLAIGDTIKEALYDAEDELSVLYEIYCVVDDCKLTPCGKMIKSKIMGMIEC